MTFWNIFLLLLIYLPLLALWGFALSDLAGRADLSGPATGLWAIAIVLLPIFGVLVYFVTQPDSTATSPVVSAEDDAGRSTALTLDRLDAMRKLAKLRDSGAITDEEFATTKAQILTPPSVLA